ncbi:MAG: NusG domain II-containing protein [Magnetococcales bacterium]|nr:NusG domain II-containing protein [Magnetococcales bacterium]
MKGMAGWRHCTNATDRWLMLISALGVMGPCWWTLQSQPEGMVVIRDAQAYETVWPLSQNTTMQVVGRLGPVTVEVQDHRVRLLEYQSPRLVGTMMGWIGRPGQMTACIPCGVIIQVKGHDGEGGSSSPNHYDGIAR